ncbi:MAG: mechanosensitive ion channel [Desulfuromonadaceae bacterium]|nr:mechanosensitive ion channel [Desulfuromonadaceae bacterium]
MDLSINFETLIPQVQEWIAFYGLRIIAAIAIFVIGRWVAKGLRNTLKRVMTKNKVDRTLVSFSCSIIYTVLLAFVVIAALNQLGIQTTSLVAILGAAGLAVGLALQGSLSNFAAGILMIIFRPFKAGDYIEGGGVAGTVEEVQVFTTFLTTPDNKAIIVPNSKIMGDNIINYSAKETRRIELIVGVSYADDLDRVRVVLKQVMEAETRILAEPAPMIVVKELAESSVNFSIRPWVKTGDYWRVYFALVENIKKSFDREGISIPFPQQDVHLYQKQA